MTENLIPDPSEALTPAQIDARHAHNLLERALNQAERGEADQAILACRQAARLVPNSFPAYSLLSMLLRRQGDLAGAIAASEKALALVPDQELERARLTELRAAQSAGLAAPMLRLGEWEHFRHETRREIELSNLLAAQIPAGPVSSSPLFADIPIPDLLAQPPANEPLNFDARSTGALPRTKGNWTKGKERQRQKFLITLGMAIFAGTMLFFVVRSVRQTPSMPVPGAQSVAVPGAATGQHGVENINNAPANSDVRAGNSSRPVMARPQQPPATSPTDASTVTTPASNPSTPSQAFPTTQTPIATPQRETIITPRRSPNGQSITTSPPTVETLPESLPRPAAEERRPAPPPRRRPAAQRPVVRIPPQEAAPPTSSSPSDVGPRFSSPSSGNDDVGPRYSNPSQSNDDVGPRFSNP